MKTEETINRIVLQNAKGETDVFLSYRSSQVKFASKLFEELDINNKISTWFDRDVLHENVGDEYEKYIYQGIKNAKIFLLIYTEDINSSQFIIEKELKFARELNKPIFCYAKNKPDLSTMSPELYKQIGELQWLANDVEVRTMPYYQDAIADEAKRVQLANLINDLDKKYTKYEDINLFLIRIQIQKFLEYSTPYGNYQTLAKGDFKYDLNNIEIEVINKSFYIPIPESRRQKLQDLKFFTPQQSEDIKKTNALHRLFSKITIESKDLLAGLYQFISDHYSIDDIHQWLIEHYQSYIDNSDFSISSFLQIVSEKVADDFIDQIAQKMTMFNGAMTGLYDINEGRTANDEQHTLSLKLYYTDYFTFKCMVEVYHILRSIHDCFVDIHKNNIKKFAPFLSSLGLGGFLIAEQESASNLLWIKRSNSIAAGNMWHFSFDETSSVLKDSIKNEEGEIFYDKTTLSVSINPNRYIKRALHEELGLSPEDVSEYGFLELGIIKSDRLEPEFLAYSSVKFSEGKPLTSQMDSFLRNAPDGKLEINKIEFSPLALGTKHFIGSLLTPESNYLAERLRTYYFSWGANRRDIRHDKDIYIAPGATIGKACLIESGSYIGGGATIGDSCKIHRNVFIDENTVIGSRVKIQNNNSIYEGVRLDEGVFVGTNVCFTNDLYPRSIRKSDGELVTRSDWKLYKTIVKRGASLGAGAVIRCGVTIGEWAMVGCGAVVVNNVPDGATVVGNPARIIQSKEELK